MTHWLECASPAVFFLFGRRVSALGSLAAIGLVALAIPAPHLAAQSRPEAERKVAVISDMGSMDPYRDNSTVGVEVQGHIFDPLVDYRGPDFTQTPLVAERWDSPDPTTWRFYLRKNVKFHDGKELTAEDVKFSLELAHASPTANAKVASITEVSVVDKYTVVIKTAGPAASLLANLGWIYILPKADYLARGADAFSLKPVGSGPYKLERWDKGQRIVLAAFDGYWGGPKSPGRIVIRPIAESSTRLAEFLTGGVDLIQDLPVENVQQIRDSKDLQVVQSKGIRQIFFPINTRADTPLKDRRVRQAINFAIDREAIVRDVLQGFGEARTGPFGVNQMGYNAEAAKAAGYNPDKARALLREAGFANGVDFTWNFCRGCWLKDAEIMEALANQLKAVGIRAKLNLIEVNQLLANQNTGSFQVGMIRWSRCYDSDTILAGIQAQSTTQKWSGSEELDKLIVKARQTLDKGAREKIYQDIYKAMVDDPSYIYVHAQDSVWGKRAATDWSFQAFAGNASLTLFYK
ncbi:MAG TPA: ABC transporter substrate-binding protein [Candidatus Methylomirabilis sp.]|nr:ABC transporter substrate-binding protein [Candidatus Methylomirabilis sp.]